MKIKTIIMCIVIVLGFGVILIASSCRKAETPAALVNTMHRAEAENDRRLAALHLFDNHLGEMRWISNPDLSPFIDLAVTATSDHSPNVRAAALDSIRRFVNDTTLKSRTGLSPKDMMLMNTNREANRKEAAAILIEHFLVDDRVKILEKHLAGKADDDLVVQTRHVLHFLLSLDSEGRLKKEMDEELQVDLNTWAHNSQAVKNPAAQPHE